MKNSLLVFLCCALLLGHSACFDGPRVKGNGHLETEDRVITFAERIQIAGSFDVYLTQGSTPSLKIEADDNLLPYIETLEEEGILKIRVRDKVRLTSKHFMKVYITTPRLLACHLMGSGDVQGMNKFTEGDNLSLKIIGSGDLKLDLNVPELSAEISGSGDMELRGETETQRIKIAGSGNYKAEDLKSEEASVSIAGNGDVRLFAEELLDVNIAGSGSVLYRGAAEVKKRIAGSGEIRKIE